MQEKRREKHVISLGADQEGMQEKLAWQIIRSGEQILELLYSFWWEHDILKRGVECYEQS